MITSADAYEVWGREVESTNYTLSAVDKSKGVALTVLDKKNGRATGPVVLDSSAEKEELPGIFGEIIKGLEKKEERARRKEHERSNKEWEIAKKHVQSANREARELRKDLQDTISEAINDFQHKTGLDVQGVRLNPKAGCFLGTHKKSAKVDAGLPKE